MLKTTTIVIPLILAALFSWNPSYADVHDRNIIYGKVKSEYPPGKGTGSDWLALWYASNGLHGDEGCLFDADKSPHFGCAGRRLSQSVWGGTTQARSACGGSTDPIGDSWLGCLSYDYSPHFQLNSPQDEYWVLHANNDPAFDQCREGPPSLSEEISNYKYNSEKLFNVKTDKYYSGIGYYTELGIKINPGKYDFNCDGDFSLTLPFLSIGSHTGAGNSSYVSTLNRNGSTNDLLKFKARIGSYTQFTCVESGCPSSSSVGSHAGFFVVAEWSSPANAGDPSITYPKFVWVDLARTGVLAGTSSTSTSYWSWPIYDSMFWPGAEIAVMTASAASSCSGVSIPSLDLQGTWETYQIDLTDLFVCASDTHNLFQQSMPYGDINVTGVHFFAEAANATAGDLELLLRRIRID